jgi:LPS export ABC transporter permease LptF/LPS export ABC transporter permease LptG
MLKSFDKYILKEIASPFGIGLLVYTFTLLINMIFFLSGTLVAKEASTLTVLRILVFMLPDFLSFTVPMATLMGILAGLSRMSTDSEIVAFRTMGVANLRILKPVMLFAGAAWLFSSWLIISLAPETNYQLQQMNRRVAVKRAVSSIKPGDFYHEFPSFTLYFNDVDPKTDEWQDVFLYSREKGENDTIILAKSGRFIQNLKDEFSYIILNDVDVHFFKKKEPEKSYKEEYRFMKKKILNQAEMGKNRNEKQLSFPVLTRRMKEEPENRVLAIEFHRKFALPFACLALGFLALPLGISTKKGGKVSGFIISLGLIFVYYTTSITAENMARKGTIPPMAGMWLADIFLMVVGIVLFYYTSKEKNINWEKVMRYTRFFKRIKERFERNRSASRLDAAANGPAFNPRLIKIIDLYVLRKLLYSFVLVFFSLVLIFYIVSIVELIDDVVENNVAFGYVFDYIYYHTPEIIRFALPVSLLTSVLLTFSVMSKHNEITAVQVSGISLYRLTVPAIVMGLIFSLGFFLVQENIEPDANKKKREVLNIIHNTRAHTEEEINKNWVVGKNNTFYFYDRLEKETGQLVNFNIALLGGDHTIQRRISAKTAGWENDTDIVLKEGFERNYIDNTPGTFVKFRERRFTIEGGREMFTRKIAFPEYMNIATLQRYIEYLRAKKAETHRYEAKLYYKYAFPLSSLIMVMIAIPFSFIMGKKGTLFGIGVAVLISMVFWFAFAVFSALGAASILSPFISAFAPIFIFTVVSVYLFMNVKT